MSARTLLHLLPAGGGGTERFVRDLAGGLPQYRHLLLHLGAEGSALEDLANRRFLGLTKPDELAFDRFARGLLATYQVSGIHLHLIGRSALDWIRMLPSLGIAYAITLHDLGFLSPRIFADDQAPEPAIDGAWIDGLRSLFAHAFVITSPSDYVDSRFKAHFRELETVRVAPGLRDPQPPIASTPRHTLPTIGVIGALGAHKGADLLEAVWKLPAATSMRWVLLGYTENQLFPLHAQNPEIIVHGPFKAEQAAQLIDDYQIDLIWFPNRLAESFSYALSECWAAGRAALVPRWGALGERVRAHGGGWISGDRNDPALSVSETELTSELEVVSELERRANQERSLDRREEHLQLRGMRVASLASMLEAFEMLYQRMPVQNVGIDEPWSSAELQRFLESQLGPLSFRQENIRLARDYGQVRIWAEQLERSVEEFRNDRDRWQDEFTRQSAYLAQVSSSLEDLQIELKGCVDRSWAAERALGQAQAEIANVQERERVLVSRNFDLNEALTAQTERAEAATAWGVELDRRLLAQATELAAAHAAMADLAAEIAPLRIKGARYDRVLAWVPRPLKSLARRLGARRRATGRQSQS